MNKLFYFGAIGMNMTGVACLASSLCFCNWNTSEDYNRYLKLNNDISKIVSLEDSSKKYLSDARLESVLKNCEYEISEKRTEIFELDKDVKFQEYKKSYLKNENILAYLWGLGAGFVTLSIGMIGMGIPKLSSDEPKFN